MYQKWPDQIFPIVNVVVSHDGHFGLGGGPGGGGGDNILPVVNSSFSLDGHCGRGGGGGVKEGNRPLVLRWTAILILPWPHIHHPGPSWGDRPQRSPACLPPAATGTW